MTRLPHPVLTLSLALVWLLLANSLAPGQVLLGVLLGWLIPRFTQRFSPDRIHIHAPLVLLRFVALLFHDILIANLNVAWLILREPRQLTPAFVVVPLDLRSDLGISAFAGAVSLTPGTVSSWLSPDRRSLVVHGLHVRNPDALVATLKRRYEIPLLKVFEPC